MIRRWILGAFMVMTSCNVISAETRVTATSGAVARPAQIPICMIGDSITWAEYGDYWRKYILEQVPTPAFVGTHTATLGYSHAGEGGNNTSQVLARMDEIPACPYYSLLIGTNDNSASGKAEDVDRVAAKTAERIVEIVNLLLKKPGAKKVFLSSLLPCDCPDRPFRTVTNARTNVLLKQKLGTPELPADRVVWVDYESVVLATPDWKPIIRLHPLPEGYKLLGKVFADAIRRQFKIEGTPQAPRPMSGCGVRVVNLWDAEAGRTTQPIIAGWYAVSFEVTESAEQAGVTVRSSISTQDASCVKTVPVTAADRGERKVVTLFTGYEGYGYTRCPFTIETQNCKIEKVLFEKMRPNRKASIYQPKPTYIDTVTEPAPGELIEREGR